MGVFEQLAGGNGHTGLVRIFGYQETVSLDARGRCRLPDELAGAVQRELGRAARAASPETPPAAFERLAFYMVPGTRQRIFVYPTPNIRLAVENFENPPEDVPAELVRQARDYFYYRMRFVEADKQNRLAIPDGLREHAGIDEQVSQVTLVAQNYWLALSRAELVEQAAAENRDAFDKAAPDLLNPVRRRPAGPPPGAEPQS
jgi:DNA-binding transcriptional regulator/RsmH inhibitor MraZ